MLVLSVDTSSSVCAVSLQENYNLIDEIDLDNGKTHSENFMPIVAEILEKNNKELKDINLIAAVVGPGSFTGIRIGIASIKALAEVYNIPVVEVTSLESLARNVEVKNVVCSLIDAKNNQVYAGIFDANYEKLEDYIADDINTVIESLKKYNNIILVGDGSEKFADLLKENLVEVEFSNENKQKAFSAGLIGLKKFEKNEVKNADSINPIYLRKSQAERMRRTLLL